MADERDPDVSRHYRELGREEPPKALDERILARARRRQGFRWYGPLAAAAILVLVVAVTVQIERRQPGEESLSAELPASKTEPFASPAPPPAPASVPERRPQPRDSVRQPAESQERKELEEQALPESRAMRRSAPAVGAAAAPDATPEVWLETIAQLRLAGRHAEADESLRQFRERHPDYRISDEVRAKVEKK